jgi:opacity protein-like surface antigen
MNSHMSSHFFRASLVFACVGCAAAPEHARDGFMDAGPAVTAPSMGAPPQRTSDELYAQSDVSRGRSKSDRLQWSEGQALMHGFFGASSYSKVEAGGGDIDGDEGDLDQLPLIGGGAQWKLGGKRFDIGFEGLISSSGAANAAAVAVGGGSAAIAVDVDLMIFELYGGPFASVFLGEKLRAYVSGGPMMQWANYDQDSADSLFDDDGSGFGTGWYVRTGLEFALASHTLIGFGVRWSESSVDLGGSLDDLEIEGLQGLFTVSQGL